MRLKEGTINTYPEVKEVNKTVQGKLEYMLTLRITKLYNLYGWKPGYSVYIHVWWNLILMITINM